ncbi:MAG: sulfotransferase [Pseudomonadota bacterium]
MTVSQSLNEAKAAQKRGDMRAAQASLFHALIAYPRNKTVLQKLVDLMGGDDDTRALNKEYFLARALLERGETDQAKAVAQALVDKAPGNREALTLLGTITAEGDQPQKALHYFQAAIDVDPTHGVAYKNLGKALLRAGELDEGLNAFRKLLELDPDNPLSHRQFASAQRLAGDQAGARKTTLAALQRFPDDVRLLEFLAIVKKYDRADDPDILRLTRLLKSGRLTKDEVKALAISAGRSLENTPEAEKAVRAFKHGNALRRAELGYDASKDKKLFAQIKRAFEEPLDPLADDDSLPKPIFIVGMPRSGTSLMEQILASHSQVFGAGELSWWNNACEPLIAGSKSSRRFSMDPEKLKTMRGKYRTLLRSVSRGEKFVTDKMPMNFRWIGFMAAVFPDAPILHMKRDPRANCWSVYKLPFPAEGLAYTFDAKDVVAYHREYRDLMEFWDELLPGRVTHVSYEYLTENQESETRRLIDICGLPWEQQTLDFHKSKRSVATASTSQVRQKMYKGSSEAWRAFAPYLPELFDDLPEKY